MTVRWLGVNSYIVEKGLSLFKKRMGGAHEKKEFTKPSKRRG